jgi:hypothetical protein
MLSHPAVSAAEPPGHDHGSFDLSFTSTNLCGTGEVVDVHTRGTQNLIWDEGGARLTVEFDQRFVHVASGATATFHLGHMLTSTYVAENDDGSLVWRDTLSGLTGQLRGSVGGVRSVDAGVITIDYTTDANYGLLGLEVTTMGPHPSGIGEPPTWVVFPSCADLVPALGLA